MKTYLVTACLAVLFLGLTAPASLAQQQPLVRFDAGAGKAGPVLHTHHADSLLRCGMMDAWEYYREKNGWAPLDTPPAQDQLFKVGQLEQHAAETVLVIPIVVHVIHNGEQKGTGANISDAQVISQIENLNEDYRRIANTPGFNNDPRGDDVRIEFRLAVRDLDGNPTTGINRVLFPNPAGWTLVEFDETVKPLTIWDPNKYMNFWSTQLNAILLGYAQFPEGSGLPGMPTDPQRADTDGVVCTSYSIGRVGHVFEAYDGGRTATHEVGHYLGLRHIWGDGACNVDDYCLDTPPAIDSNFGCPDENSCNDQVHGENPAFPGVDFSDMVENYMDYSDDSCFNIFTGCQKGRMRQVMSVSPRRASLVDPANDALLPVFQRDAGLSVIDPAGYQGGATATPRVTLTNHGSATLTSATILFSVDGGVPQSFNWSGSLATFASETVVLPDVAVSAGTHAFEATAILPNGLPDEQPTNNAGTSTFGAGTLTVPFAEDFEGAAFPPAGWSLVDGTARSFENFTWVHDAAGSTFGRDGNATNTLVIDHRAYDDPGVETFPFAENYPGAIDAFVSPLIDLTATTGALLSFDLSYARFIDPANTVPLDLAVPIESDRLTVSVSTDGGQTFAPIYFRSGKDYEGNELPTAPDVAAPHTPAGADQWRTETLDLSAYDGQEIVLKFVTENGNGNTLYLDNISVTGGALLLVETRLILEGAYDSQAGAMTTDLNEGDHLPTSQPFGDAPWNYGGSEGVSAGFFDAHPDIVDWVLLELRNSDTGPVVASRAAFAREDGSVVELDGVNPVAFASVTPADFVLVARHRNHLDVRTDGLVALDGSTLRHDFSTGQSQAAGPRPMKDLSGNGSGPYALYAGDADGDGQIQNDDKNVEWRNQVGQNGYRSADFNLNGEVQNDDKNVYWRANVGRGSSADQ